MCLLYDRSCTIGMMVAMASCCTVGLSFASLLVILDLGWQSYNSKYVFSQKNGQLYSDSVLNAVSVVHTSNSTCPFTICLSGWFGLGLRCCSDTILLGMEASI